MTRPAVGRGAEIAVCFHPSRGHLNLIVPIGESLASRHKVTFFGSRELWEVTPRQLQFGFRRSGPERFIFKGDGPRQVDPVLMAERSAGELRRLFRRRPPDLLVADSSQLGAAIVAAEMHLPLVSVVARLDHFTDGYYQMAERNVGLVGASYPSRTERSRVLAYGVPELYVDSSGDTSDACERRGDAEFVQFESSSSRSQERVVGVGQGVDRAVVSFGTFVLEPSYDEMLVLCEALLECQMRSVLVKLRSRDTAAELRCAGLADVKVVDDLDIVRALGGDALFVGHGSTIATFEALAAGSPVLVIPSHIADHRLMAEKCEELSFGANVSGFRKEEIARKIRLALSPEVSAGRVRLRDAEKCLPTLSDYIAGLESELL